jgi:tryptophan synthase beta chain
MMTSQPDSQGHFGPYGDVVPETLMSPLEDVERAWREASVSAEFQAELKDLLHNYAGRPTPLITPGGSARNSWGEDLSQARRSPPYRRAQDQQLPWPGAARQTHGQEAHHRRDRGHGVATATVCALFGLECVVYMGEEDMRRQRLNVFRMRLLGAKVVGVNTGSRTLKDAISEAMRDWVTNVESTHYLLGSALGAHPIRRWCATGASAMRPTILEREGCRTR